MLVPYRFLATYLILSLLPVVCTVLLTMVRLPPAAPRPKVSTPLGEILRRPTFLTAAITGAVGYGVMNLLMTSTPLEMRACGFGVAATATVIQAHAVAMFAPGFFTGRLITRFGVRPIMMVGIACNALCAGVAMMGESFAHFTVALVLLGLGWNFMFTGATTLLGDAHSPAEKVQAQTANDFIVFGTVAFTAMGSGALHVAAGWDVLNAAILPALALAAALIAWPKRAARPA
jgi:MFS family permease